MVERYLENYKIINRDTPILSAEFVNLPDFSHLFEEKNLNRINYGNLKVEQGRYHLQGLEEHKEYNEFVKDFYPTLKFLSLLLLKLDLIRWPIPIDYSEWFDKKIKKDQNYICSLVLDKPGFNMPWHLDNRLMIISGVINLQYNETTTIFQKDNKGWKEDNFVGDTDKLIHVGTKDKFCGTFWLNTDLTWHAVPKVITDRKIMLVNAFF